MQVETVKKAVSNSSGAGGVSLSTLRRAEDDDSDAPMKCGLPFSLIIFPSSLVYFAVPEVGNNLRIAIQQARTAKGWTQKELAQKLNEPAQIVNQCVVVVLSCFRFNFIVHIQV
jgi:hypothetical protein